MAPRWGGLAGGYWGLHTNATRVSPGPRPGSPPRWRRVGRGDKTVINSCPSPARQWSTGSGQVVADAWRDQYVPGDHPQAYVVAQLDVGRDLTSDVDANRYLPDLDDQPRRCPEEAAVGYESLPVRVGLDGDVLGRRRTSMLSQVAPAPPRTGHCWPKTRTSSPARSTGTRLETPTNSATNAVAGREYSVAGVAVCSIRPDFITQTRSAIESASSWSWVTKTVVIARRCCKERIWSRNSARTLASSAESGSSKSRTRGSMASALASATRLLLSSRHLVRVLRRLVGEPDQLEQLSGLLPSLPGALLSHPQAVGNVVERVHVREQRIALEHHPHVPVLRADTGEILSVDHDAAAVETLESGEHTQCRRLTATGRAQKGDELPPLDGEREAVEGASLSEDPHQPVELDLRTRDWEVLQERVDDG